MLPVPDTLAFELLVSADIFIEDVLALTLPIVISAFGFEYFLPLTVIDFSVASEDLFEVLLLSPLLFELPPVLGFSCCGSLTVIVTLLLPVTSLKLLSETLSAVTVIFALPSFLAVYVTL